MVRVTSHGAASLLKSAVPSRDGDLLNGRVPVLYVAALLRPMRGYPPPSHPIKPPAGLPPSPPTQSRCQPNSDPAFHSNQTARARSRAAYKVSAGDRMRDGVNGGDRLGVASLQYMTRVTLTRAGGTRPIQAAVAPMPESQGSSRKGVHTSTYSTGSCAPAPTAAHQGDRAEQLNYTRTRSRGIRAPAPIAVYVGAHRARPQVRPVRRCYTSVHSKLWRRKLNLNANVENRLAC